MTGTGRPWVPGNLQARLEMQPFSYRQAKVEAATGTFNLIGERRQQLALKLQGNFGRLDAEANGQVLPLTGPGIPMTGELKLTTKGLNPALLLGAKAPPGSLDLNFSGNFQVPPSFNWSQARLAGKLQASGKLQEYAFQELSAQGAWEAGELRLNPARLLMSHLRAEAQGRLSAATADLKLTLDLLPPGPWPLLPPDFRGQLRAEGTVKGDWQSLAYQVSFQGKSLSWRRLTVASLQGKTAGTASRETFTISNFDILAQQLTTPVGPLGQIQGKGQTQGANLIFDLKAQQSPNQSGALAGAASWEKNAAQIRINNFHWGPPNLQVAATEPVTLIVAPGRLEISPLRLRYQKTFFSLAAKVTQEDVALQVKLEDLQLNDLARFIPQISLLQGTINAQADGNEISANDFADEIDRLLHLYKPEITYSQLNLLDSHDTPRFLSCARGDKDSLKLAWLFMLTFPGAPCIYYGDEVGMDGEHDPDCRKSFAWDESKWNRGLLDYLREAISLRKSQPSLRRGTFTRLWSADGVYAFGRALEGESLLVALNASEEPRQVEVQNEAKKNPKVLFGQPSEIESKNGKLQFIIPARSGVVLG